MNNVVKTCAAVAAFALLNTAAYAQTSTPPPAPQKPGILSRLFHPKPKPGIYQSNGSLAHPMSGQSGMMGRPGMMGGSSMMMGHVVGNKKTHVYHLPGDSGSLPAPQNRVYFSSAAAAQAAGFHRASGTGMTSHGSMMHGMMVHH